MADKKVFTCKNCGKQVEYNDNRKHYFCSVECRKAFYEAERLAKRKETARIVKCEICGKEFTVYGKSHKRFCSAECVRKHMNKYNTEYITNRRRTDEKYRQKQHEYARKVSMRNYAEKQWKKYLTHADIILELSKQDNAREVIAKYLDLKLKERGTQPHRELMVDGEKEALESLGDVLGEK